MQTISMKSFDIKYKIDQLLDKLADIQQMDENAVCEKYNVDKKEEAIQYLIEDLTELMDEYEERVDSEEEEEDTENKGIKQSFGDPNRQLLKNY